MARPQRAHNENLPHGMTLLNFVYGNTYLTYSVTLLYVNQSVGQRRKSLTPDD